MTGRVLDRIKVWHIASLCAVVYICALTPGISLKGDDSNYILIGKSFLDKGFFREVFLSKDLFRSSYYYFMLPLMLSPVIAFAPAGYLLMKAIPLLSAVGSVIMLNILLKGVVPDRYRKVIILLFGLNPWVVEYSGLILTDIPYIFFVLACLTLFKRYEEDRALPVLIAAVLASGVCLYTRPFGAALFAGIFIYTAFRRRWKDLLVISVLAVVILIPILIHLGDLSYAFFKSFVARQDYFAYEDKDASIFHIAYRAARTFLVYAGSYLPDLMARPALSGIYPRLADGSVNPNFYIKFLSGIYLAWLIAVGAVRTAKSHIQPSHFYCALHLGMACLISVYVARYLLPLLPFGLLFIAAGIAPDWNNAVVKKNTAAAVLAAILIGLSLAGSAQQIAYARAGELSPEERSFVECNDWVKANTPGSSVVLSRKHSYTKLYTGRDSFSYIITGDTGKQMKYIDDHDIDIVIVGDLGFYLHEADYLKDVIRQHPERFRLLYTTRSEPSNYVYKVVRNK